MAKKGFPGGVMPPYGIAIANAIASGNATVNELTALRSQAQALVESHGDLASAVTALDEEIAKRGGSVSTGGAASERFLVETIGLKLSGDAKKQIEKAINDAVKGVLARHDAGSAVITPLSQIKSFGAGLGGATGGMVCHLEKIS